MANRNWAKLFEPDPNYPCLATSIEGLVQQISVSHLREGYTNFVTGVIPERADPAVVDQKIIERYGLNKDWRYRAKLKRDPTGPIANLEYIRFGRFYVLQATKGEHLFYERERARIRSCLRDPKRPSDYPFSEILVPANIHPRDLDRSVRWHRKIASGSVFQGYAILRYKGCFKRKSTNERQQYRDRIDQWQRRVAAGEQVPKPRPGFGERDHRFRSVVKLERSTEKRLQGGLVNLALKRSKKSLEYEFRSTGFVPWSEVKNQLLQILKAVNRHRRTAAGRREELSFNTVLHLKRWQVSPFEPVDSADPRFREKFPSLASFRGSAGDSEAA